MVELFAPIVLHIGILHLFMNTLALYYIGLTVEKIYGNVRFLFIYLLAGFSGALAVSYLVLTYLLVQVVRSLVYLVPCCILVLFTQNCFFERWE